MGRDAHGVPVERDARPRPAPRRRRRALRDAGLSVVMFETSAAGTMLPSGWSPTHEEYLEARRRGKRISFWLQRDASRRQGHATDFGQEVQAFHTTGQFAGADDLARRLLQRLAEVAADDEAPWVKVGHVACKRAAFATRAP